MTGWAPAVLAVLVRPALWPAALGAAWAMLPRRWWATWPPRLRPDPAYLRFRMTTQYGDPGARPVPADLVDYLRWRRSWQRARW